MKKDIGTSQRISGSLQSDVNPRSTKSDLIPELTGVRFFLALIVVIFHFGIVTFSRAPAFVRNVVESGYTSVSIFFLLSGYVLSRSYTVATREQRLKFWIARIARITPAYATAMAVSVPLYAYAITTGAQPRATITTILTAITCTHAWFFSSKDLWNFPAWSLSCEFFFYALFPFLVPPIARLDRGRLRLAIVFFGLLSVLPPLLYLARLPDGVPSASLIQRYVVAHPAVLDESRLGVYEFIMYTPLWHLPMFLVGVGLGRYKITFAERQVTAQSKLAVHVSLLTIMVILMFSGGMPHLLLHNSVVALCFSGFMFNVEALWKPLSRLLASSVTVVLGEASYALYILQFPLESWYSRIIRHLHLISGSEATGGWGWPLIGLLVFLCAGSVITFVVIERPSRVLIRSTLTRWLVRG